MEENIIVPGGKISEGVTSARLSNEEKKAKNVFWVTKLDRIKHVVAPMVDQSELAFRMMMRSHGAHLCYSPMLHAHLFVNDLTYRKTALLTCKSDRPLIVQFCANDAEVLLSACRLVEGFCDGVDLNLGCPQLIAKRGHYGSYLQEDRELVCHMVEAVYEGCHLPISCKIRILDDLDETVEYAKSLIKAGASMLTVHGRTREQRGPNTGVANWEAIRTVCKAVDVPVIANGNIQNLPDVERCIRATGAVAVMSAEGVLSNPLLFEGRRECNWVVANEYLDYAICYKANISAIRAHLFRMCHYSLLEYTDLREKMSYVCTVPEFRQIITEIEKRVVETCPDFSSKVEEFGKISCESVPFEYHIRLFPHWICKSYIRPPRDDSNASVSGYRERRRAELEILVEETGLSRRQIRKRERRKIECQKTQSRKQTYPKCLRCTMPASQGCKFSLCRNCCRYKTTHERLDCSAHHFQFQSKVPRCFRDESVKTVVSVEVLSSAP